MSNIIQESNLSLIKIISKGDNPKGLYKCFCGNEKELFIKNVKRGNTKSCGCIRKIKSSERLRKHGLRNHPLYRRWSNMITRCYNPNYNCYHRYGGIGVTVCDEWRNDFQAFYNWAMENGWNPNFDLDKDKKALEMGIENKEYSPKYCQFIDKKDNNNHTSKNRKIEYNGDIKNMSQWAKLYGISCQNLYSRLKAGWSIEKSLLTPVLSNKK